MNAIQILRKLKSNEIQIDTEGHRVHCVKEDLISSLENQIKFWFKEKKEKDYNIKNSFAKILKVEIQPGTDRSIAIHSEHYCFNCGKRHQAYLKDENTIALLYRNFEGHTGLNHDIIVDRCEFEDREDVSGTIEITSKLVLANSFYNGDETVQLLDAPAGKEYHPDYCLNCVAGRKRISEYKATNNIAYGQSATGCLSVFANKDRTKIILADYFHDDREETEDYLKENSLEYIGRIDGGVRRWEATDLEQIKQYKPSCLEEDCEIVDVKLGKYQFSNFYESRFKDSNKFEVAAMLEWVSE